MISSKALLFFTSIAKDVKVTVKAYEEYGGTHTFENGKLNDSEDSHLIACDGLKMYEEAYANALKTFTEKYPEGYHLTLKDGDFETTISGSNSKIQNKEVKDPSQVNLFNIFDLFFGL